MPVVFSGSLLSKILFDFRLNGQEMTKNYGKFTGKKSFLISMFES